MLGACSSGETKGACELGDLDGIIGGDYQFEVTVNDVEFSPKILKAQNSANVRLKLTNSGTVAHNFLLACQPTPNDDGCPQQACFEDEAQVMHLEPGESVTIEFAVPRAEGLYEFKSTLPGPEPLTGQFIVS
ncbi:MAG TPA: hypothetical protein VFQ61_23430 [Polyangiaceae bacterium]|nr:hypothetical protein [Polyangiaceae bacterium]